jgi:hypothetical protein
MRAFTCHPIRRRGWQARRESNPQPAVLETAALPIELLAYKYPSVWAVSRSVRSFGLPSAPRPRAYSTTLATTPAPTVRPPSRIAKRSPSSIAMGAISVTVICVLSPGITISVPAGNSTLPVTSVVRK